MARRTFDVVDVTEILIHWYAGTGPQRGWLDGCSLFRRLVRCGLAGSQDGRDAIFAARSSAPGSSRSVRSS